MPEYAELFDSVLRDIGCPPLSHSLTHLLLIPSLQLYSYTLHHIMKPGVRAATAGVALSLSLYSAHRLREDRGVQRSLEFWKEIAHIYCDYRFVQLRNETLSLLDDEEAAREYRALHAKHTDHIRHMTYKMGGFYLKSAQFMSVLDDFVPPEYMKWVKDTQDRVPSGFESAAEVSGDEG
jgi:hypothetical protein